MSAFKTRNDALIDWWSAVHLVTGVGLAWIMHPALALAIMVAWEPFEIFILSPLLAKIGITFGYETLRNSLSDIFFDIVGVAIGYLLFAQLFEPPFYLFSV